MARRKKKRTGIIPKLLLAAFVIYTTATLVSIQVKTNAVKREAESLDEQIATEKMREAQLEQALSDPMDDEHVRSEMQKQGYAAPNEQIFVDISGK